MKQLDFENQGLEVDFMTFSIPGPNFCEKSFADYFSKLKFNSKKIIRNGNLNVFNQPILINEKNDFKVIFVQNQKYPKTIALEFSGPNASRFYFFIKNSLIDWKFFKGIQLTRLDICFIQKIRFSEKSITKFFHDCQQFIRPGLFNKVEINKDGLIYKVGHRRSTQHYRIYYKNDHLRFEYEIKKDLAKYYTENLLKNDLEFFESDLSERYLKYSSKIIPLKSKYSSWLVYKLRYFRKMYSSSFVLKIDYIKKQQIKTIQDEKSLLLFMLFLAYIRELDYEIQDLGDTRYRCISFKVSDFLKFKNESYSYYRFKKLKDFLYNLQTNFIIQKFSNTYFQSLVSVPKVEFSKEKKSVMTKIWVVDDLFYYQYPFSFPYLGMKQLSKHEVSVLSFMLTIFTSSISLDKHYDINQFLESNSTLSNKDIKLIKEYFIKYIKSFVEYNLIENEIFLSQDKNSHKVNELTTQNISEGFTIFELLECQILDS